jgi:acetoin:2,6-dichlorophenolindophenol oxidoreductase subunit alpha
MPAPADLLALLEQMWVGRLFEETVSELYAHDAIKGLIHVGIGQEAAAVGVAAALAPSDYLYGSHRAHIHALARGADPGRLLAEIAGRATGYCRGKGGSMHIAARDVGFLGATGIVGGNIPLALGSAFACRERGEGQVVAVCFGDGAAQAGYFHESLNLASLWTLPVVLVCENNGWAEFTPHAAHSRVEHLSEHAKAYGMPGEIADGNDVVAVRAAVRVAVERAGAGKGPTLVELLTYRLRGHYVGDLRRYREAVEETEWKAKDPIRRCRARLEMEGADTRALDEAETRARARVAEARRFALDSDFPPAADVGTDVYA